MMKFHTVITALLAPTLALANGNNLAMVGATYDTSGQKFGSGALSGGYGVTPPGACYNTPALVGPFPQAGAGPTTPTVSFEKDVWIKAPTALPSTPQLIFGDESAYIAESTTGFPVFGTGPVFTSGVTYQVNVNGVPVTISEAINDGRWHLLTLSVSVSTGGIYATGQALLDGGPTHNPYFYSNGSPFPKSLAPPAPLVSDPYGVSSIVTGIGGGTLHGYGGISLGNFAGEIDEASCTVPATHFIVAVRFRQAPFPKERRPSSGPRPACLAFGTSTATAMTRPRMSDRLASPMRRLRSPRQVGPRCHRSRRRRAAFRWCRHRARASLLGKRFEVRVSARPREGWRHHPASRTKL